MNSSSREGRPRGLGDLVTMGGTRWVRDGLLDCIEYVDYESAMYTAGQVVGGATAVACTGLVVARAAGVTSRVAGSVVPVVVVQGNPLNRSRIATAVCVPLTSNLVWADAPGSALLPASTTGLQRDSVAKATRLLTLDRSCLVDRVGRLESRYLAQILHGIDIVLGR